jgi:hypothetical protein
LEIHIYSLEQFYGVPLRYIRKTDLERISGVFQKGKVPTDLLYLWCRRGWKRSIRLQKFYFLLNFDRKVYPDPVKRPQRYCFYLCILRTFSKLLSFALNYIFTGEKSWEIFSGVSTAISDAITTK